MGDLLYDNSGLPGKPTEYVLHEPFRQAISSPASPSAPGAITSARKLAADQPTSTSTTTMLGRATLRAN